MIAHGVDRGLNLTLRNTPAGHVIIVHNIDWASHFRPDVRYPGTHTTRLDEMRTMVQ